MALIKCFKCGNKISSEALKCPHCGLPQYGNFSINNQSNAKVEKPSQDSYTGNKAEPDNTLPNKSNFFKDNKYLILSGCVIVLLVGYTLTSLDGMWSQLSTAVSNENTTNSRTDQLPMLDSNLEKLKMQEIGIVIKNFLPDTNEKTIEWDYKANDPSIIWLHKPYLENNEYKETTIRKGVFRSNALGVKTTYLQKDKMYELPWAVVFKSERAKLGVKKITFSPLLPDINIIDPSHCFGREYRNCDFDPIESLKNVGVNSQFICGDEFDVANFDKLYLLTAKNKKTTYAIHSMSMGSGGATSAFSLILDTTEKELCDSLISQSY